MGSVGDAYGNALAERALTLSLSKGFSTLKCELLARRRFRSQTEARVAAIRTIVDTARLAGSSPFSTILKNVSIKTRPSPAWGIIYRMFGLTLSQSGLMNLLRHAQGHFHPGRAEAV